MNNQVKLAEYQNPVWHDKGRGFLVRSLWHCVNAIFLQNPLNPSSQVKVALLRSFGARIGRGVIVKPGVNVKSPWKLEVGSDCWIGERVWLDTVDTIKIGNNVCISQDAYFCTGNHNWSDEAFGLLQGPITLEDGVWVGARATVLPGTLLKSHCVVTAGGVVSKTTEPYTIYTGNPAMPVKKREITCQSDK